MSWTSRSRAGLIAALCAVLAACGLSSEEVYDATGSVVDVDPAGRQVTIAHEAIPGFMPAMTMNFDVAPEAHLEGVTPGDRIRFSLERSATTLRVLTVERTGRTAGVASAPPRAVPDERDPARDFTLIDQNGYARTLAELRGSAVLLDFIFTRCGGPCPILTSRQVRVQKTLDAELATCTRFLSISLDPEYDRPRVLKQYAEERGAKLDTWTFLTGTTDDVQRVLTDYGVGSVRVNAGRIDHLVATFLIDRDGRIARRYLGVEDSSERIVEDLRGICS
jgi:protein SCO1